MEQTTQHALEKNHKQHINSYHTRPSEFGIVNEKFPDLPKRSGHSYHIFKYGHCEYLQELGYGADRITEYIRERGDDINGAQYVLRYTDIAEAVEKGLTWLELLWRDILPFEYLDFQYTILNSKNSTMFSYEDDWGEGVCGHPTKSNQLLYKEILPKDHDVSLLELDVLKWISNCYGLVLESKLDGNGKYRRPTTMR